MGNLFFRKNDDLRFFVCLYFGSVAKNSAVDMIGFSPTPTLILRTCGLPTPMFRVALGLRRINFPTCSFVQANVPSGLAGRSFQPAIPSSDICQRIGALPGLKDLGITTNGLVLEKKLPALQAAGVNQLNVSLDTLVPEKFEFITRRKGLLTTYSMLAAEGCSSRASADSCSRARARRGRRTRTTR